MVQRITLDAILTYDTDHSSPSELRVPCASPGTDWSVSSKISVHQENVCHL